MDAKGDLPGFEERFAEARGCRLRYLVAGEGEPQVLVPELPGHGGSAPLPAAPSLNAYADRIALLMERPAAVVGHSLGGAITLRMAIRRPELVTALVLAGPAGISSGTRQARYALTMTSLVKPGKRIAPYRRRVARSALLKTLVFGRWGVSDPPALPADIAESFLSGPARHTDTVSAAKALIRDDPRGDLDRV